MKELIQGFAERFGGEEATASLFFLGLGKSKDGK
jgi:hypothetical protein